MYSKRRCAPKDSWVVLLIYRIHFGTPFLFQKAKGVPKFSSISCINRSFSVNTNQIKHHIELYFRTPFDFWIKKGVPKWILYIGRTTLESLGAKRRSEYTQWRFSLKSAFFKEKRHCVYVYHNFHLIKLVTFSKLKSACTWGAEKWIMPILVKRCYFMFAYI